MRLEVKTNMRFKKSYKEILHMKAVQQKQKLLSFWSQFDFSPYKYVPFKTVN